MTMLYLVRHAEQERAPAAGSELPAGGLSARGREQARLLGERLRAVPLDGLHHSPVLRAEQTAHLLARSLPGVPVHSSPWLTDRTPMPAPGQEGEYSVADRAWLATTPPAEQDPGGREITAAMEHFASLGDTHHLLVTHAFVVGWFVRAALEAPVRRWLGLNAANAGLTVIHTRPGREPELLSYNDCGHLLS